MNQITSHHPSLRHRIAGVTALALSALSLWACATRVGDFTVISTRNFEIGVKYVKLGTFEGKHSIPVIIFPIGQPNMKDATDDCLKNGKGEVLTNAVVYFNNNSFFFGVQSYTVKGDVWTRADVTTKTSELYQLEHDDSGAQRLVSVEDPAKWVQVDAPDYLAAPDR